jgi:hypothetical protein
LCSVTTVSSWLWTSRHSRTRRTLMKFWRSSCSYCRFDSLWSLPWPPTRFFQPLPQAQVAGELALLVVELGVLLVGLRLHVHRPVAHVLQRERRGDHQHLLQRAAFTRLQDHAAHARVQRQARQLRAHRRELVVVVHRAQFVEQLVAVGDGAPRGRSMKGKSSTTPRCSDFMRRITPGQRGAQDLGVGEARPAGEVLLVVEADADAVGHPAAAAGALVGGGLADRLHQQLFHLAAETVALDARGARCRSRSGCPAR